MDFVTNEALWLRSRILYVIVIRTFSDHRLSSELARSLPPIEVDWLPPPCFPVWLHEMSLLVELIRLIVHAVSARANSRRLKSPIEMTRWCRT